MNTLTTDKLIRYSKVILMAYISFFGLLVMIHNFTDYDSNYTYVAHILSMDTTTGMSAPPIGIMISTPMMKARTSIRVKAL
mgnify:CR=1 FL=1